ncbi:type II secretion system F family protein [Clostridium sardiniense]|uniref:Type II secretion system F family protein n=1 Tax=Clostridium sardiniense TaxID=29369 RepID=A0ABS7KW68_CLOSR|nr:type II secretion system F family protein [Clostridium sardiniense]MBY0754848.1 type II secretion system F family protein [Clostridium sardiniense]MDQ0461673.1 type IV pilus assembly protein PilC [Clostridium sardiniense]
MKDVKKYSYRDISIICENLCTLYNNGLQITRSIELLEDFPLRKDYKLSIKKIAYEIKKGSSLEQGFSIFKPLYPSFFLGMISIGEKTGKLSDVFREMSIYYKRKDTMKKEIINASIYPMFLIGAMIFMSIFFILFIIPQLEDVYLSVGSELPYLTKVLLNTSKWVNNSPIIAFSFIAIWGVLVPIIVIKPYSKRIIEFIRNRINILKEIREYEMILLIKVIISSGINISLALKYCEEENSGNKLYKKLNDRILKGDELSKAINEVINLSKYTIAMIKLGEESGSLDERLEDLTETLSKRCNERFKKIAALLQPTVIILMAFLVVFFLGVFVLPMFDGMYGGIA